MKKRTLKHRLVKLQTVHSKWFNKLPAVLVAGLVAIVGSIMLFKSYAAVPVVYNVPASIPADCSRNVETDIMNFIASVPDGSTIQFPAGGCYQQANKILVKDRHNLIIEGSGSQFITSAKEYTESNGNWMLLRGSNITIQNMTSKGSFDLVPPYSLGKFPAGAGWENHPAYAILGTDTVRLYQAHASHVWGDGVFFAFDGIIDGSVLAANWSYARHVVVDHSDVQGASRTCWAPTEGSDIWIQNSTCRDAWMDGLDAEVDGGNNGESTFPLDNLHFINLTFDGYNLVGLNVPWSETAPLLHDFEIRGNHFLSGPAAPCNNTILVGASPDFKTARYRNMVIEDNEIWALTRAISINHVDGGSIQNNAIHVKDYGLNPPDGQAQCGEGRQVVVNDSTGVTVANNGPNVIVPSPSPSSPPPAPNPAPTPSQPPPTPTPPPAPTPNPSPPPNTVVKGQTIWSDNTTAGKSGTGINLSISATGADPNVAYFAYSALNGCTTDQRTLAPAVTSDSAGNIPMVTGSVTEGGQPRRSGAYEICFARGDDSSHTSPLTYTVSSSARPATPPKPGDINNDGQINIFDLSILLSRWNTADPAADLNHNGTVDIFDLSILLSKWGG